MWRGLYTAAAGMVQETVRTDTIANNLANVNTSGYKGDTAVSREFEPMLIKRINDQSGSKNDVTSFKGFHLSQGAPVVGTLGLGAYIDEVATDHSQGVFESTGNPYDLAISGDGYFAVQTPQGVRYTRDGAFFRSSTGFLQDVSGHDVLDTNNRPIQIPENATDITVGEKGQILARVDGAQEQVGQLALVSFGPDRRAVLKQGDNLYRPQAGAAPQPAAGTIEQGMLERSNVNVVDSMVSLINNYRIYEAGSKAVMAQDSMLDKSVNEVGKL